MSNHDLDSEHWPHGSAERKAVAYAGDHDDAARIEIVLIAKDVVIASPWLDPDYQELADRFIAGTTLE